jgi:molecular chaperone GrpE
MVDRNEAATQSKPRDTRGGVDPEDKQEVGDPSGSEAMSGDREAAPVSGDDVELEAGASTASEGELVPTVEGLTRELENTRAKEQEYREGLLRAQAELENTRRRAERELANAHKFGVERLLSELLPVCDSMEMGLAAAVQGEADPDKVQEGLELTLRMFQSALEKFGVEQVDPKGEKFNPEYHEAMSMQDVEGVESGAVTTVVQKGYLLNGRLVRPAMVMVAK